MKQPVMINDILDVEIIDLTYLGFGLCKVEDFSIFVENALPNELIKIKINRVDKRFAFGEIVEILKGSEDRIEPKDSNQTQFGTMPLQHLSYNKQLEFKKKMVMDSLSKFMDVNSLNIKDPIGMEFPWQYRNKAQVPVRHVDGNLQTGFFKRETHDLIPVENYLIQEKEIDEAILIVRDILRKFNISAYDEEQHEGLIRHLIIRRGHHSKELMIVMVTRLKDLPRREEIVKAILEALPNTVSIIQNINSKKTNVILGHQQKILFGDDIYFDTILDLKFGISSKSFYQVNSIQTEKLYAKALEFARINKDDTVIDAYCGIGTISLLSAQQAKHVYGVEMIKDAIEMARYNQTINDIDNVSFEIGKAEDMMTKWANADLEIDVLIVDPPRKGLEPAFIEASVKTNPKRIVYISCNPATLARDLNLYVELGYNIKMIQPVDMFPHTTHVECVALMSRVDN